MFNKNGQQFWLIMNIICAVLKKNDETGPMRLLIFGVGYSALRFCELHEAAFFSITGTVRTQQKAEGLLSKGHSALVWPDHDLAQLEVSLRDADHILISVPPDEDGDPVLLGLSTLLRRQQHLKWIGYWSSIAVYGDTGGAWVNESATCAATSPRGLARLRAEVEWSAMARECNAHLDILRLPGIYGPGRSSLDTIRAGTSRRILKTDQVFNRIHVDDIAGATLAAIQSPNIIPGVRVMNVTDNEPAPPQDVIAYASRLLNLPLPPEISFETAKLSPMARSFYADNKRVSNARLADEIGYQLIFPTYREGLTAIAAYQAAYLSPSEP
jgi:nucleoside-diphosphate-sugar epimerase